MAPPLKDFPALILNVRRAFFAWLSQMWYNIFRMRRLKAWVFGWALLFLPVFASGKATSSRITKPDSNFKSIHQFQWEAHAESTQLDTASPETTQRESFFPKNRKSNADVVQQKRQVINIFLISGIALLLLSGGAIIFILLVLNRPKNTS